MAQIYCWLTIVVILTTVTPAWAKQECNLGAMIFELMGEENSILEQYTRTVKHDRMNCKDVDIDWYLEMNKKISVILKKYHCAWEDLASFTKIEDKTDLGCMELELELPPLPDDIPVVPLVGPMNPPQVKKTNPKKENNPPVQIVPEKDDTLPELVAPGPPKTNPMPSMTPQINSEKPPPSPPGWAFWTGLTTSVVGIGIMGGGGYFGVQANNAATSARKADFQSDVLRYNDSATSYAGNANLMFGIGAAVTAVGVTLVVLDFTVFSADEPEPATSVSISAGPGSANLMIRFP